MEHPDIVCDISAQDALVNDYEMGVIPRTFVATSRSVRVLLSRMRFL